MDNNLSFDLKEFPKCPACTTGSLLPFFDYTQEKENVFLKGWACSNSMCGHNLFLSRGQLSVMPVIVTK